MALVGTISGSNGTSRTAITGTLIVANQPGGTFPGIPADTILYVSSGLDMKNGSTPGVATFAGDIVLSGSSYYEAITTPVTTTVGRQFLDNSDYALSYFTETGLRARPGRQHLTRARNNDTATISKGNAVRLTSSVGSQTTIIRAIALTTPVGHTDTNQIIGIAAEDIAVNATGYVCTLGRMTDIDTSGYTTEGGILYVSSVTSGAMTQTQPVAPSETITVGTMIRKSPSQGDIYVHPIQPLHLADIQSFSADPSTWVNGSSMVYDSVSQTWKTQRSGYILSGAFEATSLIVTGSSLQVKDTSGNVVAAMSAAGVISGSGNLMAGGNITGSNMLLGGNIAVHGGNLTTLNNTFNIFNTNATSINLGGAATSVNIGASTGRTTVSNDLSVGSGNIIGGSGGGPNVLNLISSGNVIVKLDIDNSTNGHTFEVQDYTGSIRFKVSEDNAVEVGGTLFVTGFSTFSGNTTLAAVSKRILPSVGGTGTVSFDLTGQSIFYVNGPNGNITANFTNVLVNNNRIITPTVILSQSATPRLINALQIDSVSQTILWLNNSVPVANANKQDIYDFSLIRSGSGWTVLGQMNTYG